MNDYGVVLFYTTSAALRSEKVSKGAGFTVKLVPVPRQFSSDCGIALRFDWSQNDQLRRTLEKAHLEIAGIHEL